MLWLLFIVAALLLSWYALPEAWTHALLWLGRRGAGLRSQSTSVNGLKWHYLAGGHGPVLLAIHGFGADADHWLRVAPRLRRHFRIVAPDLIGFGSSDPGEGLAFDIDSQVDRLAKLVSHLGIRPCVVAGSSMGGWIAARFVQRHPKYARALWLLDPLGVRDCEPGQLLVRISEKRDSPLEIATIEDFERWVYRPMFSHPPPMPRPLRLHYGRHAIRRRAAHAAMFSEIIASPAPLEEIVKDIDMPILLLWGTRDQAVHVSGAKCLEPLIRRGRVLRQDDVGHLPMLESARLTARQFLEFADDHGLRDKPMNERE